MIDWLKRAEDAEAEAQQLERELAAARIDREKLREALQEVERMAGAAGSGEVPALPIAERARKALGAPPAGEPRP